MAVSYISSDSAAANTVTMPTHQALDLILVFAFRDGNTTAPTMPSGYTLINTSGANTCSGILAYKIANSAAETTGTWTNATGIVVQVYRGAAGVGASAVGGGTGTTITYPAVTLQKTNSTSWAARFAGHRTATNMTTNTPSGYTQRTGIATEVQGSDSNAGLASSPTSATQSVNQSSGWRAHTVEILVENAKFETISDNFDNGTIDLPLSNWGGAQVVETGGRLQVTVPATTAAYYGVETPPANTRYTLYSSSVLIELVDISDVTPDELETEFQVLLDTSNRAWFLIGNSVISCYTGIGGVNTNRATTA